MSAVRLRGFGWRHAGRKRWAVRELDLRIEHGERVLLLGASGAGKSTLLAALAGLLPDDSGEQEGSVEINGRDPRAARDRVGSVFQDPEHQFVTSTVADELALGPRRGGWTEPEVRATVDALLDRLRLTALAGANPYTLSGGEARRLSVATALATAPRLLVCDEPTFGQDRRTWWELVELFAELRDHGHALVAVTHDTEFITALADRQVRLEHRRP